MKVNRPTFQRETLWWLETSPSESILRAPPREPGFCWRCVKDKERHWERLHRLRLLSNRRASGPTINAERGDSHVELQ